MGGAAEERKVTGSWERCPAVAAFNLYVPKQMHTHYWYLGRTSYMEHIIRCGMIDLWKMEKTFFFFFFQFSNGVYGTASL